MSKSEIKYLYLINEQKFDDRNKFPSEEVRAARYSGILPEVAEALSELFSDGEFVARERLIKQMTKRLEFSDMYFDIMYFFRYPEHKIYFEEKIKSMEIFFGNSGDFSAQFGDCISAFSFLSDNPNEARFFFKDELESLSPPTIQHALERIEIGMMPYERMPVEKYYRYALHKGYVTDFRGRGNQADDGGRANGGDYSPLFMRIGGFGLIDEGNSRPSWADAYEAVRQLLLDESATQILLDQFDRCGRDLCSTPEWEGTLLSIAFMAKKGAGSEIASYIKGSGNFSREIARNSHFYDVSLDAELADAIISKDPSAKFELGTSLYNPYAPGLNTAIEKLQAEGLL